MLRAKWRELETELRTGLNGHEGGNPGYSQASVLTGHRASSRPYIPIALSDLTTEMFRERFPPWDCILGPLEPTPECRFDRPDRRHKGTHVIAES